MLYAESHKTAPQEDLSFRKQKPPKITSPSCVIDESHTVLLVDLGVVYTRGPQMTH